MPTFSDIYNKNAPSAFKDGTPGPYTGTEGIKDLADAAGSTCGKTDTKAAPVAAPSNGVVTFDISAVHIGPCELWLDDTLMANATNCWTTYADKTIPLDYSKCSGSQCQIRWVWLATHNDPWEIFDNCVNVVGGSSASTGTTTDKPTTEMPSPTPVLPSSASSDTTPGTVAPSNASISSSNACSFRGNAGNEKYNDWCESNCNAGYCPASLCEAC
ncbi:hypothetical protein PHMEG_00021480 [Phytophthora megakarya]|uniref:Chitin-binding type-4 domain-containing protein n=1 Tax=Phytophthora megakarya TaxID=4795 RepID=A0A225VNF2_9STRA|nr:hypothetical protein PHMEG_00021480 [Phytophthora megakarya]